MSKKDNTITQKAMRELEENRPITIISSFSENRMVAINFVMAEKTVWERYYDNVRIEEVRSNHRSLFCIYGDEKKEEL